VLGELVQTTAGQWMTQPPTRCPNGHALGPNEVLVGLTDMRSERLRTSDP